MTNNSDYTKAADIVSSHSGYLDVTVDAVVSDPDDENRAYVLGYDAHQRAYFTCWVDLSRATSFYWVSNMDRDEALLNLIIRSGFSSVFINRKSP
jgi:hypothetical protein